MRIFLLMCLGMTLVAGCQMPASIRTPSPIMDKISPSPEDASAVSSTSLTTAQPPSTITIRAVYYLSGDPLNPQIWRTPLTGGVSQQVTHIDPPGISDFDIDPAHGAISFITDHRLFILPYDNSTGSSDAVHVILPEELDVAPRTPRWSPDGTNLAVDLFGCRS